MFSRVPCKSRLIKTFQTKSNQVRLFKTFHPSWQRFETALRGLAADYPDVITGIDGWRHMTTLCFADIGKAKAVVEALGRRGLDISAQTYKAECPPVALMKLPLVADQRVIDFVVASMREVMKGIQ